MKNVLITGGAGYTGYRLGEILLSRGYKVRIFDQNTAMGLPSVEQIQGDIRDIEAVRRACNGVDIVFHNVAQVPLAKNKKLFWSVNKDGTRVMLDAALQEGVRKVVYTSSSAIFGVPAKNPVTAEVPPSPAEDYGRAKLAGENLCLDYSKNKGLQIAIVRPRTILGHGRLGIFQILFEWIRRGYNVPVLGQGDNVYQFIHVDDLCEAMIAAGELSSTGIYNCGTDRFGTMREGLEATCAYAKTGSKVRGVPFGLAVFGMKLTSALGLSPLGDYHALMYGRSMYFDLSHSEESLGWKPKFSNNEMLIESYQYYLDQRESILARKSGSHHQKPVKQKALNLVGRFL